MTNGPSITNEPPPQLIRVLIVDDHPIVRMGLVAMIDAEVDLEVVGEATDGGEGMALVEALRPDVVLMDLRMPNVDGVTATTAITSKFTDVRVLVVTTYERDADILRAVEAGASGYVLKDTPPKELAAAVRAAANGETVLAPTIAAKLVSQLRSPATSALTAREVDVLKLVATGSTNVEIGTALHISAATVKTHLLRAFAKLGVDDRTAAVTVARERGVLG